MPRRRKQYPRRESEFALLQYPDNQGTNARPSPARSSTPNRGRGRGNGPRNGFQRGRGAFGFGRGRGAAPVRFNGNAALSKLLHEDRPFLRPIVFVRSTQTPFLFQVEEEILKPVSGDTSDDIQSHLPTADKVARVFHTEGYELEEIDFNDLDKLQDVAEVPQAYQDDEQFTGKIVSTSPDAPPIVVATAISQSVTEPNLTPQQIANTLDKFYVDTEPFSHLSTTDTVIFDKPHGATPLGAEEEEEEEEEVIVYVAPHPRNPSTQPATEGKAASITKGPTSDLVSFNFSPSPRKVQRNHPPIFTAHGRNKAKIATRRREAFLSRGNRSTFGSFAMLGAITAEAHLKADSESQWNERRQNDSDIDWGDDKSDSPTIDTPGVADGMDLDPELELDANALTRFAQSMTGSLNFKTMDDVADERKLEEEDLNDRTDSTESSDQDTDLVFDAEEKVLVGEAESEEGDSSEFEERLERYRHAAATISKALEEGDDDFDLAQEMLEKFGAFPDFDSPRRKHTGLHDILTGDEEEFWTTPRRPKNKGKALPPSLQAQWEQDRQRKAERKRQRELERLQQAVDPLVQHKTGKKARKAMKAVARLDPSITVIPNRVIDMTTLVQQIRRFIHNLGGPQTMSLPPTDKATRAQIHELANAFQLKSVSKGKGDARYTTLTKTSRTGLKVNEKKIGRIVRRNGGSFVDGPERQPRQPRYKEGEEVGKAASKIGESNIGFKLLASMGWSQGERIGLSGGLQDPLTAIIKHTKLGLGARS